MFDVIGVVDRRGTVVTKHYYDRCCTRFRRTQERFRALDLRFSECCAVDGMSCIALVFKKAVRYGYNFYLGRLNRRCNSLGRVIEYTQQQACHNVQGKWRKLYSEEVGVVDFVNTVGQMRQFVSNSVYTFTIEDLVGTVVRETLEKIDGIVDRLLQRPKDVKICLECSFYWRIRYCVRNVLNVSRNDDQKYFHGVVSELNASLDKIVSKAILSDDSEVLVLMLDEALKYDLANIEGVDKWFYMAFDHGSRRCIDVMMGIPDMMNRLPQALQVFDGERRSLRHICCQRGWDDLAERLAKYSVPRDIFGLSSDDWQGIVRYRSYGRLQHVLAEAISLKAYRSLEVVVGCLDIVDDEYWDYPLHAACANSDLKAVKILTAKGFLGETLYCNRKAIELTMNRSILEHMIALGVEIRQNYFPFSLLDLQSFRAVLLKHPDFRENPSADFLSKLTLEQLRLICSYGSTPLIKHPNRRLSSKDNITLIQLIAAKRDCSSLLAEALFHGGDCFAVDVQGIPTVIRNACQGHKNVNFLCNYLKRILPGNGSVIMQFKNSILSAFEDYRIAPEEERRNWDQVLRIALDVGVEFDALDLTLDDYELRKVASKALRRDYIGFFGLLVKSFPRLLQNLVPDRGVLATEVLCYGSPVCFNIAARVNRLSMVGCRDTDNFSFWGENGFTLAICFGNTEVVDRLLCYYDIEDPIIRSAFDLAVKCGRYHIALLFLFRGMKCDPNDPVLVDVVRGIVVLGGDLHNVVNIVVRNIRAIGIRKKLMGLSRDVLSFVRPEINYCIRQSDWSYNYGGDDVQQYYNKEFHQVVNILSQRLKSGYFLINGRYDLNAVLDFLGIMRSRIAFNLRHEPMACFGRRRALDDGYSGSLITFIGGRYGRYRDIFEENRDSWIGLDCWKPLDGGGGQIIGYTSEDHSPETAVYLTLLKYGMHGKEKQLKWSHTNIGDVPKALAYADDLFNNIMFMSKPNSLGEVSQMFRKIGEFHWWLAHACPFQRGSAGSVEMFIRAIFLIHNMPSFPWKECTAPDCMALVTPDVKRFIDRYRGLFAE